jgi:dockerin type I repeat protein
MKKLLLIFLPLACFAQSLDLTVSPAVVAPGGLVTVTVNFTDSATTSSVAGIQATLPSVTGAPALASVATQTQKALAFNSANGITMVVGSDNSGVPLNDTAMPSGALLTFVLTAPAQTGQTVSVALTGLFAVSTAGGAVPLTSAPITYKTRSKYDLNGDGVVDQLDVNIASSQAQGLTPCTNGDVNGDGRCNVQDVHLVIRSAQGKIGG